MSVHMIHCTENDNNNDNVSILYSQMRVQVATYSPHRVHSGGSHPETKTPVSSVQLLFPAPHTRCCVNQAVPKYTITHTG